MRRRSRAIGAVVATTAILCAAGQASAVTTLSPASHDYGSQTAGSTSAPFAFTLNNACLPAGPFPPESLMCLPGTETPHDTAGMNATGDYAITSHNCPPLLAPTVGGNYCTINVAFAPTLLGLRTGVLAAGSGGSPSADLLGTGTAAAVAAPVARRKKCKRKRAGRRAEAAKKKCKKRRN